MKRVVAVLALVALLASSATAVTIWQLTRGHRPQLPEISAYTHGQLVRVGPYKYCDVFDLTSCDIPANAGELGVLEVTQRDRVQLSVPPAIARAPWILLREYEDDTVVEEFRPDTTLAVTIPTYDAHLGRLTGIAVQLPTLVRDEQDNEFPWPHAEWSVATVWA
jgi:uncharacterized protein DUF2771